MNFKNDFEKVVKWLNSQGGSYTGMPGEDKLAKLNAIAEDCMRVYTPRHGDRELVGWFVFGDVKAPGNEWEQRARNSDGICRIGPDGKAAIGINLAVLDMDPIYARVAVGLHELAHLSVDDHNDMFVTVLMNLQYRYYHEAKRNQRADSREIPGTLVGKRIAGL